MPSPNVVVLSATSALGGFLAGVLLIRHGRQRTLRKLLKRNYRLLSNDERQLMTILAESGHEYLFRHWPVPGVRDTQKRQLVVQAAAYLAAAGDELEKARQAVLLEPKTIKKPKELLAINGDTRQDPYYWLRDDERHDTEVLQHLKEEDEYARAILEPTLPLQEQLYQELRSAIQEADQSAPVRHQRYFYYTRTEEGKQYRIHCRRPIPESMGPPTEADIMDSSLPEEVLLDENAEAKRHKFYSVGATDVSPNHKLLAYAVDTVGGEKYTLHVRDLATGKELLSRTIEDTASSFTWANDNRTLFYVTKDSLDRPEKVWKHEVGTDPKHDVVAFHETDDAFYVHVGRSRSDKLLLISSGSAITSEVQWLDADNPGGKWEVLLPRKTDVEYDVIHRGDHVFITIRDAERFNSELLVAPLSQPEKTTVLIKHNPDEKLEHVSVSTRHLVAFKRVKGLQEATVYDLPVDGSVPRTLPKPRKINFAEPAYTLECGAQGDFDSQVLRLLYSSLMTPMSTLDYNLVTGKKETKKVTPVLGGFDANDFHTERVWAESHDSVQVPISIVYRKDTKLDGSAPCLLNGYGSYEICNDPDFNQNKLPLLNRGFVFAIAHIRGGGEMGRTWYENGKYLKKRNTFKDFIASAEHLINKGYTSPDRLCIEGRSAGGLLIGATLNEAPKLFAAAIAGVPFVDCLTTMLDPSIPLTVIEYEEWGNPQDPQYYTYIKSYSPYDNVTAQQYPNILVTAGLHDPRVGYWEPAKWVAKLRDLKTDNNLLLFKCELGAGHFSVSGRFERLREVAMEQAFLIKCVGKAASEKLPARIGT